MVFSILSIIISILSMISKRNIIRSRDYVSVEFDIKGAAIISNINECQNRKNKLQIRIASLIGIDRSLIEMVRPKQIKHGLKIKINFHINNTRAIDMNIEKDIKNSKISGELANIMQESWSLSSIPTIENLTYSKYESKERRNNTELITVQSVSNYNMTYC